MDLNYLYFRHQVALFRSEHAACELSRQANEVIADAYAERIGAVKARGSQTVAA